MKIGTHVSNPWDVAKFVEWTDFPLNQSFLNPTKQKSVASNHPIAWPTSSEITNCLSIPGFTSTKARKKLLNRIAIPTLIQNDRGICRCPSLLLILYFILLYSANIHCPMNLLSWSEANYRDVLIQYAMFLFSYQEIAPFNLLKTKYIFFTAITW